MFSGPDYLYVDTFFPNGRPMSSAASNRSVPCPILQGSAPALSPRNCTTLQASLNSVLNFSFFITKEMKSELQNHELSGILPVIYIFLARSNKIIHEVSLVGLDQTGAVQVVDEAATKSKSLTPGVKITFSHADASGTANALLFQH